MEILYYNTVALCTFFLFVIIILHSISSAVIYSLYHDIFVLLESIAVLENSMD